ncbi:hypothetical protein PENSTE_c021G03014 [Penicillium steckii]|uniref:Uncharacterized protein n=1 Tax=Penicillium steckii TaxID=303698 RepID=A0A1V6ST88_9EURO|nr:hypothetical protein PENSTE_c021G03014 [Penicillium steckii]
MARDKIPLEILELIKGPVPEKKAEYYVERRIRQASRNLRRHIYQVNHDSTQTGRAGVKFLLQESPGTRGARCRLLPCGEMIEPGEYRVHVTCRNGFFHVECFERMMEYSFNEGCGEQVSLFRPDLNRLAGPMEACILKEYVRRTLSRIGAQPITFSPEEWGVIPDDMNCEEYFVSPTDPAYDEHHILSAALKNWEEIPNKAERL